MSKMRRFLPLSLLALTVCAVIFGNSAIQSTVRQPSADECRVTMSGAQNADRLLTQEVWEATFKRIASNSSGAVLPGIDRAKAVRLAGSAANALLRANALRQSLPTAPSAGLPRQASQDRDLVVADSILDARDSELRALSTDEFEQLTDYAMETASTLNVTLPVSGRVMSDDAGNRSCELKVKGTDYPHLVLEHHVWGQMFKNLTALIELSNERFGGIPNGVAGEVMATDTCNTPCGQFFDLGGEYAWNGNQEEEYEERINQRYMCDCQPPPGGCSIEGCVWLNRTGFSRGLHMREDEANVETNEVLPGAA